MIDWLVVIKHQLNYLRVQQAMGPQALLNW